MGDDSEQLVDELLVMDAQSGRVKAMETLVCRWQKRLWRYARRLTGDTEAAWDVTQEAWLGIVRGIGRLSDPARFRAWAFRIVTNKANDWLRKAARVAPRPADPAVRACQEGNDTTDDLHHILRRLPERSRTVLTQYYLEEFPLSEVARILRVPKGTVKSRLHKARAEFKRLWQTSEETRQASTSANVKGDIR
jgi:RNA polymerase sigma-70 factor (ECF subfamily)